MASLINRVKLNSIQNSVKYLAPIYIVSRGTAIPPRQKVKTGYITHRNLIKSDEDALKARGFLRSQKPYNPPENIVEQIRNVITHCLGEIDGNVPLLPDDKFKLLNACFKETNHSVPNSLLHRITNCMDVLNFYTTPVSTTNPLDEFKEKDLPPNLHIQYEYVRFHPETDTMFNGVTAFNESSTIVTGLKYRKKYKGHKQKMPQHYDHWSDFIKHEQYKV